MKPVKNKEKNVREVFLTTAADEQEYEVYKSMLEACGIPVLKKAREAGDYLNISMGMNVYGVDIYVPEKYHKTALELLKGTEETAEAADEDKELEAEKERHNNKRLTYIWIILAVLYGVPLLLWLIYSFVLPRG